VTVGDRIEGSRINGSTHRLSHVRS
jgi:hypothetical protein